MRILALLAVVVSVSTAVGQSDRVDPAEEAAAAIRRATAAGPTGDQHALLVSLRALQDPKMRPLFESLAQSGDWSMRVDGILGLAETSENKDIEPFLVSRLGSAEDRSAAIRGAISLGLVKPASIQQMLGWSDLTDIDRIVLVAELDFLGEEWDYTPIKAISTRADVTDEVRGMASLELLAHDHRAAWDAFAAGFSKLSATRRNTVLQELAKAALTYKMKRAVSPLLELASDTTLTPVTVAVVNGTALALDRDRGLGPWRRFVERERGQTHLVRAALQLLGHAEGLPPGTADVLRNGEPLVEAIADAITACSGSDPAASAKALADLVRTHNRQATEWALRIAQQLPATNRAVVERAVIEEVQSDSAPATMLRAYLVEAAQLADEDPSFVEQAIRNSREPVEQELLLLGLNNRSSEKGAALCESVKGSLSRRGEALALLSIARSRTELTPTQLAELGRVASGGGDLDPSLRIQAAWLFLRHSGRLAQAMAASRP